MALKGSKLSKETRERMSNAKKGKKHSKRHKRAIGKAMKGNRNAAGNHSHAHSCFETGWKEESPFELL